MSDPTRRDERSPFERFLGLFAEVRAGEGLAVLLLFLNIFLILTAYYVLKVVREALTIGGVELWGIEGDEIKAYLAAVMALLLLGVVPAYGLLASKVSRVRLIKTTMGIVVVGLLAFFVWGRATGAGNAIGISFYIFLGIINYFLIAQFWSYANDIYTEAQGKRLFAIIAIGQSLGAVVGPKLADAGADYTFLLLAGAAGGLVACIALFAITNRLAGGASEEDSEPEAEAPLSKEGGFALVFRTKYLLLIAFMILVTNVVNTTGEYILSNTAKRHARDEATVEKVLGPEVAARVDADPDYELPADQQQELKDARSAEIGRFYGDFFFIVNIVGLLIQMFLVSRIFKYFGVRAALFVLPVIAFGGYAAIGLIGGVLVIRIAKTAENATDYSLQNTVKQALFLPTSREAKYKAKQAIDTFFVRFGDAASAAIVALGLHILGFGISEFAYLMVGLAVLWILINAGIAREHKKLVPDDKGTPDKT